jgi:prepilin-type N-terminal cleavage/methylation domain-containing protein
MRELSRGSRGFTLVELVAVIVILAIVAVVSVPRMTTASPFSAKGYADHLAASLRQARAIAIASQCDVQFTIDAAGFTVDQRAIGANNRCATAGAFSRNVVTGMAPTDIPAVADQQFVFGGGNFGAVGTGVNIAVYNQTITLDASGIVR